MAGDERVAHAERAAEAVLVGAGGGALGFAAGSLVDPTFGWALGGIAAANGLVSGWRRIYSWRRRDGWLAFVLDSTWATLPVVGSLVAHVIGTTRRGMYEPALSLRQNRHVYRRGMRLKPTFALTIGNVISNAGNVDGARRRRLITDHEDVHVWQSRWFGPIYPIVYAGWAVGGAIAGSVLWVARGRRARLGSMVESCAYYLNPFEWWAYSRDDHWPPGGKVAGLGWRRPIVRPLAQLPRRRHPAGVAGDDAGRG